MLEIATDLEQLIDENTVLHSAAASFYLRESEHHSMAGHIQPVWVDSRIITSRCMAKGHELDVMVVDANALFHDADSHKPLKSYGFKTVERRSASIARRTLPTLGLGYTSDQVKQVSGDIITTANGMIPTTKTGVVLNRADINNVGDATPEFLKVSVRVAREYLRLNRQPINHETIRCWLEMAPPFLSGLVEDEPDIPGFDLSEILEEKIPFRDRAIANIEYLGNISVARFLSLVRLDRRSS
jgi:hypothetical protein